MLKYPALIVRTFVVLLFLIVDIYKYFTQKLCVLLIKSEWMFLFFHTDSPSKSNGQNSSYLTAILFPTVWNLSFTSQTTFDVTASEVLKGR